MMNIIVDGKGGEQMTNTELLGIKIKEKGLKKGFLCKELKISYAWLKKRLEGEVDFRVHEMQTLCRVLNLNAEEKAAIFFEDDVEDSSTSEV